MVSRTLLKLIDQAILPAVVLLSTRILSILAISRYYGVNITIDSEGFTFPSKESYILVNSYSTMAMIGVLAIGILYILYKAYVFHDTHITPFLTAKLFSLRLSSLIQNSYELYSQAIVWLAYLYLTASVTGVLAFFGFVYKWSFYTALVMSIISTVVLVVDIENEMDLKRSKDDYIEDDSLVDEISLKGNA